ncbi:putative replication factor C subunit 3 [Wickerhamomyces ciferrii]|uniref:Replication factor C subunit 3 n=1 Tax=Wickerhamomyces ciferrii (strain ATCC 14091 / BCRC 22168 / CBS 111 / JCM 3599 / NBRC 0793 / NRRL Y-1031 F-60-10) TaxID=1206466 RepID=K0KVL8_WICCF|nr:putative replication factor C subunit 3 [Wickerhamomyces ciferrii]CCH45987.1 putative replication factor C subunit 3 [Wickerhamomyces ciferrii]
MSLWVDKYRPHTLDTIDYHFDVSKRLKALVVYGPSGAGKKTRVIAVLHELFGAGVEKMKIDVRTFTTSTNRKLEFNVVSSPYHMEITPSDLGNNDRVVIQDLLKEIAQTEQVDFSGKHRFKVVIINEADSLSRDAQAALRRTMEKYSKNIRLVLISNTTSNIIAPIKSRTLLIRISAPNLQDITKILDKLSEKQEVSLPSSQEERELILNRVAIASKRNLRRALLNFEALVMQNQELKTTTPMITLDWEGVILKLASNISRDRNVARISSSRTVFYELISHCIPPKLILKNLTFDLLKLVNDNIKPSIVELASIFDERLSLGTKSIFHLEGFVAKTMVAIEKGV